MVFAYLVISLALLLWMMRCHYRVHGRLNASEWAFAIAAIVWPITVVLILYGGVRYALDRVREHEPKSR